MNSKLSNKKCINSILEIEVLNRHILEATFYKELAEHKCNEHNDQEYCNKVEHLKNLNIKFRSQFSDKKKEIISLCA